MTQNLVETRLLEATLAGDDASRDVYADWLEGNADTDRADFLRLQRELRSIPLVDPRYDWRLRRLHALRVKIDPAWLAVVDPKPVLPFEVELAQHLAGLPPAAVEIEEPVVELPPPPPAARRLPRVAPQTWGPFPPMPSNEVPRWISIGSACAGAILVVAFVVYALVG